MPPRQQHKKKNESGTEGTGSVATKRTEPNSEVRRRVDNVATLVILTAGVPLCIGLFLLFWVYASYDALSGKGSTALSFPAGEILLSVLFISLSILIVKIAMDFRKFKRWTYSWVELITRGRRGILSRNDLYDEQVRRAFDQPEYEYPRYPEYGYKLEEKRKERK